MCNAIQLIRLVLFFSLGFLILFAVLYANAYCKKRKINMNTLPGFLEMYRSVLIFENKKLSLTVLGGSYGGALLVLACAALTFWGRSKGCDFPINR